jgi:hypothetical protein
MNIDFFNGLLREFGMVGVNAPIIPMEDLRPRGHHDESESTRREIISFSFLFILLG